MKIEIDKVYKTYHGGTVVIISELQLDPIFKDKPPFAGILKDQDDGWKRGHLLCWYLNGSFMVSGDHPLDIIEEIDDPILMAFLKVEYEHSGG